MVSAQIAGTLKVYIVNPAGISRLQASAPLSWWGPSGSSVGVIATTPEKWNTLNYCADTGASGYKLRFTFVSGAASTTDASDAAWVIPIMVNGMQQFIGNSVAAGGLGNDNFTVDLAFADKALVVGDETPIAEYRAKEGVSFKLGGGKVFASIEDNA